MVLLISSMISPKRSPVALLQSICWKEKEREKKEKRKWIEIFDHCGKNRLERRICNRELYRLLLLLLLTSFEWMYMNEWVNKFAIQQIKTTNEKIIIQTIKFVRILFVLYIYVFSLNGFVYETMNRNNKATSTAAAATAVIAHISSWIIHA